jgi:tetratricopeptide (TPR) repeat protein
MTENVQLTPQEFLDRFSGTVFEFGKDGHSLHAHFDVGRELVESNLLTAKVVFKHLVAEHGQSWRIGQLSPELIILTILAMVLYEVTGDKYFIMDIPGAKDKIPSAMFQEAERENSVETSETLDDPIKILEQAHLYREQGQLVKAEQLFKRAIFLVPNAALVYNDLGLVYTDQRKPKEARSAFKKAIELDFRLAAAHRNLGLLYLRHLDDLEQAAKCFKRAIRIQPDFFEAHNDLGAVSIKNKDLESAQQHFEAALNINPDYMQATNNLAMVYFLRGRRKQGQGDKSGADDLAKSAILMNRVIELAPESGEAKMARYNLKVLEG